MEIDELRAWVLKAGWLEPWSKEQALERGQDWFYPVDQVTGCARICERGAHLMRASIATGRCVECEAATYSGPRAAARRAGLRAYYDHCPRCRAETEHSVTHGKCLDCYTTAGIERQRTEGAAARKASRSAALAAGQSTFEAWCHCCGSSQLFGVHSRACTSCNMTPAQAGRPRGRPASVKSAIMRECPDLVLPRKEAMAQGWIVFRDGHPCENGHRGWRYVATSQCVECGKKKPA